MKANWVVVDASVALSVLLPQSSSETLSGVMERLRLEHARLVAPGLFWLEVMNALVRRQRWDAASVLEAIYDLEQAQITTLDPDRATLLLALDLAERFGLSVYDAAYLALAQSIDGRILTIDGPLASAAGERAIAMGDAVHERATPHERRVTWPSWSGASAYLASLRAEAKATASRPRAPRPGGSGSASRPAK